MPDTGSLARHVPVTAWLPRYDRSWLSKDALAGLSVWALLVPQGIAYASIAGVPPQYGLYAALGGLVGYALPRALIAVVLGVAVSAALDLSAHGVDIVGEVPTGLPSVGIPDVP